MLEMVQKFKIFKEFFDNFCFLIDTQTYQNPKSIVILRKKTLNELSTYFPEIDGVGIKADLTKFYDMWQTFC